MELLNKQDLDKLVEEPFEKFLSRLDLRCPDSINAIPIEWIKNQIENPPYSHSWELGERWKGEYTTCLMVLLEDWEKENGA